MPTQMHADDLVPLLPRHLVRNPIPEDPRKIHYAIDPTKLIENITHENVAVLKRTHITEMRQTRATSRLELGHGRFGRFFASPAAMDIHPEVVHHHRRFRPPEFDRNRLPDTVTTAGNHDYLITQHMHRRFRPAAIRVATPKSTRF